MELQIWPSRNPGTALETPLRGRSIGLEWQNFVCIDQYTSRFLPVFWMVQIREDKINHVI